MVNKINFIWLHGVLKWDMKEGEDFKSNIRPTSKGGFWAQFEIDIQSEAIDKKTGDVVYWHDTPTCRTFNQDHIKMLRGLGKGSEIDVRGELQKRDYKKDGEWKKGIPVILVQKLIVLDKKEIGEVDAQRQQYKQQQGQYQGQYQQSQSYQSAPANDGQTQLKSAAPEWMQQLGAEPLYVEDEGKQADIPF